MPDHIQIAPSILSADFANLGAAVRLAADAGADWIHVDVMDGHFVPNLTIGPGTVRALKRLTAVPLDVHLMVDNPAEQVPWYLEAGADLVTFHYEACVHINRLVQVIHDSGAKAGIVLNPATSVDLIDDILPDLDLVLLMSVNPGLGGQRYLPGTAKKVRKLQHMCQCCPTPPLIEVDGGIDATTAPLVTSQGARILVAGSAIYGAPDPAQALHDIRAAGQRGLEVEA
jgi:ribulose-phosphate 3-epimerase